jgi:hypothetical protein
LGHPVGQAARATGDFVAGILSRQMVEKIGAVVRACLSFMEREDILPQTSLQGGWLQAPWSRMDDR